MNKKLAKIISTALCLTMVLGSATLFAGPTKEKTGSAKHPPQIGPMGPRKEQGSAKHPPKFAFLPGTVMLPGTDEIIVIKEKTPDPRKDQGSAHLPPNIGPMGPRKEQGSAKHPPQLLDPPGNDVLPPKKSGPQGDLGRKGEQESSYGTMPNPVHVYDGRPKGDSFKDIPNTGR